MAKKKKKKLNKRQRKQVAKLIFSLILLVIIIIAFVFFKDKIPFFNQPSEPETSETAPTVKNEGVVYDNLQFHFLELGVAFTGDSTYIKAGDVDILIDAGARKASAESIIEYVDKYCTDKKLEYVIVTHADQDHIAGMVGNKKGSTRTGILYYYEVDTLIDFAYTTKTSQLYYDYLEARDYAISKGTKHYTAAECWNNENGACRTYTLDSTNNITMDIIYNKYYFELDKNDENNHSVCTMFNYNEQHFFFTGDLEEKGEKALADYYNGSTKEKTLPHVKLFKAGHHGSRTSSNDCLLDLITPEICTVCCCAGTDEYTDNNDRTFPTQEFINRIAKHTDAVYVTSTIDFEKAKENGEEIYKPLNGTIVVSSDGKQIGLAASNNLIKLKDSDWFNEKIYVKKAITKEGIEYNQISNENYYTSSDEGVVMIPRRTWPTV